MTGPTWETCLQVASHGGPPFPGFLLFCRPSLYCFHMSLGFWALEGSMRQSSFYFSMLIFVLYTQSVLNLQAYYSFHLCTFSHMCVVYVLQKRTHTHVTCDTCILFHCCQGMQPVAHKICGPILGPGPACSWGGREQLPRLSACTRMGSRADSCPTPPAGVPSPHLL